METEGLHAQSVYLCWTLCDPMGCSMPGSSVHTHACPPPEDLPDPGIEPMSLASPAGGFFTTSVAWEAPY